jgi:multimeric flavodoxin WrbA
MPKATYEARPYRPRLAREEQAAEQRNSLASTFARREADMRSDRGRPFVLGLLGSPRKKSNTAVLLEGVLNGAAAAGAEAGTISLRELKFSSCLHCRGCDKEGRCVVRDDWQIIYPKIRAAKHLVLASPVQFSGVSGQMKSMIDRGQCFWVEKYRLKRPVSEVEGERRGLFVATCGGRDERVFGWAKHTVKAFFNSAGFCYWDEIFEAETDAAPPIGERADILAKAEALGRRMVEGASSA